MSNPDNIKPAVSVVIPTHRQKFLADSLDALARQLPAVPFEVVVSENGHRDPATERLVTRVSDRLKIKHVYNESPGINLARNLGVRCGSADIISLLDDDCVPDRQWLANLAESHQRFPAAGVIGGRTELSFLTRPPRWLSGQFRQVLSEIDWSTSAREILPNEWLVGANMSFRRKVYEATGGFADDLGMRGKEPPQLSCDEVEFYVRARRYGALIYYPGTVVKHKIPANRVSQVYFDQRFYGQGVSDVTMRFIQDRNREPASYLQRIAKYLYDPSWLLMINRFGKKVPRDARAEYYVYSLLCRISRLRGMIDAARIRLPNDSLPYESRYYRFGRRTMAAAQCSMAVIGDLQVHLWQAFESITARRNNPASLTSQRVILGRVAYLKGMHDSISAEVFHRSPNC